MDETERNRQIKNTTGTSRVAGMLMVLLIIVAVGLGSWAVATGAFFFGLASIGYAYRASELMDGSRDR